MPSQHARQGSQSSTTTNLQSTPGTAQQPSMPPPATSAGVEYILKMFEPGSYVDTIHVDDEDDDVHINGGDGDALRQDGQNTPTALDIPAVPWRQGDDLPFDGPFDQDRCVSLLFPCFQAFPSSTAMAALPPSFLIALTNSVFIAVLPRRTRLRRDPRAAVFRAARRVTAAVATPASTALQTGRTTKTASWCQHPTLELTNDEHNATWSGH